MTANTFIEDSYKTSLQMLETGKNEQEILSFLASSAERASGEGSVCSILVVDKEGVLRNGASPRLPHDYLKAIDGLRPHPNVGTCAAAAATGKMVITRDFYADNKWSELRHLPVALGFRGAWSLPIKSGEGEVLGTFGTYYREMKEPSEDEIKGVELLARAAAFVLSEQKLLKK